MKKILIPLFERLTNYEDALKELGAQPFVTDKECDIDEYDGLLLPGGGDVDPALYGQVINGTYEDGIDRALDELQLFFLKKFAEAGKPIIGICRGQQLINVCFGGTLIQHLPTAEHHSGEEDLVHQVETVGDSYLKELYGSEFAVNSSHHQAVDRLAEGFRITLVSDDGVTEAIEHTALPIIAVQFHPERMCFERSRKDTVDGQHILKHFLEL